MLRFIDSLIDRVTMYRLLLYYLLYLLAAAAVLGQLGHLGYHAAPIIISAAYLVVISWLSNQIFKKVWEVPVNAESSILTGLILALIISPVSRLDGKLILFLTAAAGLAIASKYIIAPGRKHIFNPAALAVVLTSLGAHQSASWWVGTPAMLPFVVAGGLLIMRKIRRVQMVTSFIATALLATIVYGLLGHQHLAASLHHAIFNSAVFFLAFVMLTEPMTSPTTAGKQRWYGVLTGMLFPPQVHLAGLYSTPEIVIIIGNAFSYLVSSRAKVLPKLVEKNQLSPTVVDFVFKPDKPFDYKAGQYMEWTLPHDNSDSRGERRYLTLASSPTENTLRLGVKFSRQGSTFKRFMLKMGRLTPVAATQLAGDFVLPDDPAHKLVFIAGGIGITPFRSMLKYLIDSREARPVSMLYAAATADELVYTDVIEQARHELGIQTQYVISSGPTQRPNTLGGYITADLIKNQIPDYHERTFYISGSHPLVESVERALRELGLPWHQIKVDFFPGYA